MNTSFFERQEASRRSTALLLLYFLVALVLIVLAVDAVFFGMARGLGIDRTGCWYWHAWSPQALIGTLLLIVGGSTVMFFSLIEGGHAVARMVSATPLDFATHDPRRRQLVNVVEEMAIASGVRMPALYVMEREQGINAFVAGYDPNEAVLVVTLGALEQLSRAELQGVVGHEFSHILNGDMRINIRLIALLSGILALGQMGSFLMSYAEDSSFGPRWRRFSLLSLGLGFSLWAIGYIGLFFGRLIKAAISRQREALADASSVQFTRSPEGLASALMKIGEQEQRSYLGTRFAESMSHMCFGPALNLSSWFATHPSLEERIAAIAPADFMPRYRARRRSESADEQDRIPGYRIGPWDDADSPVVGLATGSALTLASAAAVAAPIGTARVGTVRPQDVEAAASLKVRLPTVVIQALRSSTGARALVYALMAAQQAVSFREHRRFLFNYEGLALTERVAELRLALADRPDLVGLPLVDLALPRLALLRAPEARELVGRLRAFSQIDRRLSVFEFALLALLSQQLLLRRRPRSLPGLARQRDPLATVLACLARYGELTADDEEKAYQQALAGLLSPVPPMPVAGSVSLPRLELALSLLAGLAPADKRRVLEACLGVVQYDGRITRSEYELMRVIAAVLGCPLPLALHMDH